MNDLQYSPDLLRPRQDNDSYVSLEQMQKMSAQLEDLFRSLKLPVTVADYKYNNVAIVFRLVYRDIEGKPNKRFETKLTEIRNLQKDIEVCLHSPVEMSGEGNTIVLAVKSFGRRSVTLNDMISSGEFRSSPSPLTVAGGTDISGGRFIFDLAKLGSLLIVGVTGSGKTTYLNDILLSILAKAAPEQVQFVLMDFKGVELQHYEGIPYMYYDKAVKDPLLALQRLKELRDLSDSRSKAFSGKGILKYSDAEKQNDQEPRILIVIDEFIELYQLLQNMYPLAKAKQLWHEVLACLEAISEKTVQTGIHLVLVAQTPLAYEPDEKKDRLVEWKVVDALRFIRNRACLVATSQEELKRIVNMTFHDRLLGEGDMYFYQGFEDRGHHIQTANVESEDVDRVVKYIRQKYEY